MKTKNIKKVLLTLACGLILTGCSDDDIINYPSNEEAAFVTVADDKNGDVTGNQFYYIYKDISSSASVTADMLTQLKNIFVKEYLPTGLGMSEDDMNAMIKEKYEKSMLDTVKGGSYSTDNKFNEYRYALAMMGSGYDIKVSSATGIDSAIAGKSLSAIITDSALMAKVTALITPFVITPEMEWADVFTAFDYSDYITRYFEPSILRQILTAYYIYDQSYSAIGNTSARGVTIVKITDRSDKPGYAGKLVKAYIRDYILDKTDKVDLHDLARLWKGVNTPSSYTGTESEAKEDGYITTSEKAWLSTNGVQTLTNKIEDDVTAIQDKNQYTTDSTLESTYTGSYTYPVEHGVELAEDSLRAADYIVADGTYLKSNGLETLPDTLRDRLFSSNYSSSIANVEAGTTKDNSYIITHDDGTSYRFVTPEVTSTTGTDEEKAISKLYYYDASNSCYYITMINMDAKTDSTLDYDPSHIIKTSTIAQNTELASEIQTFRKSLAVDTAYEMAASDTYQKSATTYFLTHNHISYSDPDFYDYMLSNYPDAFDDDNKPLYEGK